jgi:hypothetical protein
MIFIIFWGRKSPAILGKAASTSILLTGGSLVTDGRVTQNLRKKNWEVIIPMMGIIYFSGDSLEVNE